MPSGPGFVMRPSSLEVSELPLTRPQASGAGGWSVLEEVADGETTWRSFGRSRE